MLLRLSAATRPEETALLSTCPVEDVSLAVCFFTSWFFHFSVVECFTSGVSFPSAVGAGHECAADNFHLPGTLRG